MSELTKYWGGLPKNVELYFKYLEGLGYSGFLPRGKKWFSNEKGIPSNWCYYSDVYDNCLSFYAYVDSEDIARGIVSKDLHVLEFIIDKDGMSGLFGIKKVMSLVRVKGNYQLSLKILPELRKILKSSEHSESIQRIEFNSKEYLPPKIRIILSKKNRYDHIKLVESSFKINRIVKNFLNEKGYKKIDVKVL